MRAYVLIGAVVRLAGMALLCPAVTVLANAAEPVLASRSFAVITQTGQIRQLANSGQRLICAVRLTGVVCWCNPTTRSLILQDETGAILIEPGLLDQTAPPGQRILLTGDGLVGGAGSSLCRGALVDNDGTHAMIEQSGAIYLRAGRHPLSLAWFSQGNESGLEVYYEGPGLLRTLIPNAALFRRTTDSDPRSARWTAGLDYRYFEGTWPRVPDFSQITPIQIGTTTNFNGDMVRRTNDFGMEFSGFVEVSRDGIYTFSTRSDDGSRLWIGESSLRLEIIGPAPLPAPHRIIVGQPLAGTAEVCVV
jgi:hypothetical protein